MKLTHRLTVHETNRSIVQWKYYIPVNVSPRHYTRQLYPIICQSICISKKASIQKSSVVSVYFYYSPEVSIIKGSKQKKKSILHSIDEILMNCLTSKAKKSRRFNISTSQITITIFFQHPKLGCHSIRAQCYTYARNNTFKINESSLGSDKIM